MAHVTGCVLAHSPVYREQVQYILYTSQQCHNMYDVAAVCVAFFGFILFCTIMKMFVGLDAPPAQCLHAKRAHSKFFVQKNVFH